MILGTTINLSMNTIATAMAHYGDTRPYADARVTLANYYDSYGFRSRAGFDELQEDGGPINHAYGKGNLTGTRMAVFAGERSASSSYSMSGDIYCIIGYDIEGNQTQQVASSIIDGMQVASYILYTRLGYPNFENTRYNHAGGFYETIITHQYDATGNKTSSSVFLGSFNMAMARDLSAGSNVNPRYIYDSLGRLSTLRLTADINYNYNYNLRGQLTGISSPAFSQTLSYETGDTPCYNGNISQMTVAYGSASPVTRRYSYDRLNRLVGQTSTDGCNTAYSYNLNSSPLTVMRRGLTSAGTVGVVDDLTMSYNGNLLSQVVNAADAAISGSSPDYMQQGQPVFGPQSYSYDSSGRLKSDPSRGITSVTYHENDRPALITTQQNGTRSYEYDNDGNKLSVRTASANSGFPGSGGSTLFTRHAYCGSSEYDYTLINKRRNTTLTRINLPWGYLDGNGKEYRYIADYQGNIRAVTDSTGTAVQTTDYYPYGLPMATSTGAAVNPYKYGGKEFETGLGLNFHDFEARMLFNDRTLFNRPDPQAAKYPHLNPYLYCAATPLRYTDPTGEVVQIATTDCGMYEWREVNGNWGLYNSDNEIYSGTDEFANAVSKALSEIMGSGIVGDALITYLSENPEITKIQMSSHSCFDENNQAVGWSSTGVDAKGNKEVVPTTNGPDCSPVINLTHELAHAAFKPKGFDSNVWIKSGEFDTLKDVMTSDIFATHIENQIRADFGKPLRTHYLNSPSNNGIGPRILNKDNQSSVYFDINWNTNFKPLSKRRPFIYRPYEKY